MSARSWSIKKKLVLITTGICCSTLLVAGTAIAIRDRVALRHAMVRDLTILADVIGRSAAPSLLFEDDESAEGTLRRLSAHPRIVEGRLYDAAGRPFAEYRREPASKSVAPASTQPPGYRFRGTHLELFETISQDGATLGSLCIITDLEDLTAGAKADALVLGAVLAGSALLAFMITARMQRLISEPILKLAEAASEFGRGNLSLRVDDSSDDEVGSLAKALDQMARNLGATTVSKNYVDRVLETMVDSLIVTGTDRRIERVNRAATELLRYGEGELLGQPIEVIFSGNASDWPKIHEVFEKGLIERIETRYRTKDGEEVPVAFSAALMSEEGTRESGSVVFVARNIAERKEAERRLIEAREAAIEASRLKSEFLANMSHEIRTPLNGVIGMTELALDTELTAEQRNYLETVKSAGVSLLSVINDVLDFSKIEAGKLEFESIPFLLRDSVSDAMRGLAARAHEKGLELTMDISPDLPNNVVGDPARLRQVIVNLVGNAIKFTEKGGVNVRLGLEGTEGELARYHFVVSDTGIGIPAEKQSGIFEAFAQADGSTTRRYGGTGLGLAICSNLVSGMSGRLWVESEVGKGTDFHFVVSLPLQEAGFQPVRPTNISALKGAQVLVVDDDATNCRILVGVLKGWRLRPRAVSSGAEALEELYRAVSTGQAPALVLLDAQMPEIDGFAVARRMRETPQLAEIPIIMLTSSGRRGDGARCQELGIEGYLVKPVEVVKLSEMVRTVLGGEPRRGVKIPLVPRHSIRETRKRLRVLLAEDNEVNRIVAQKKLEKRGHEVTVVKDGLAAVKAYEESEFDVVLMDIQMPVMDGFQATAIIRERQDAKERRVAIIALTAHAMKGDRERCLEAGMDDYITKPFKTDELIRAVEASSYQLSREGSEASYAPVLNSDALWERVDFDHALVMALVKTYYQEVPPLLQAIREGLAGADTSSVGRAAHRLRGTLSTLGAEAAAEPAQRLESLSRDRKTELAEVAFAELETELGRLDPELASLAERE
jgi:PAS domain S-box-containing protein